MKVVLRLFFKTLRLMLAPWMLLWERLTTPEGIDRDAEEQARLDAKTQHLALYQFRTCPFCIKVRRTIARHSLKIETRDAQHDQVRRRELADEGGQIKVPCLRITDSAGHSIWLYESGAINAYLEKLAA